MIRKTSYRNTLHTDRAADNAAKDVAASSLSITMTRRSGDSFELANVDLATLELNLAR